MPGRPKAWDPAGAPGSSVHVEWLGSTLPAGQRGDGERSSGASASGQTPESGLGNKSFCFRGWRCPWDMSTKGLPGARAPELGTHLETPAQSQLALGWRLLGAAWPQACCYPGQETIPGDKSLVLSMATMEGLLLFPRSSGSSSSCFKRSESGSAVAGGGGGAGVLEVGSTWRFLFCLWRPTRTPGFRPQTGMGLRVRRWASLGPWRTGFNRRFGLHSQGDMVGVTLSPMSLGTRAAKWPPSGWNSLQMWTVKLLRPPFFPRGPPGLSAHLPRDPQACRVWGLGARGTQRREGR